MVASAIRPSDIQNHLYTAFLEGITPDVVLRISGRWRALYRLHRVILIQADFFRTLFTAGFLESSIQRHPLHGIEEVDITFDDPNITRAAFELCLARLYGAGPPLHVFKSLIPTAAQPLSPSFRVGLDSETVPDGHHPATPRFTLSLLATSIYLGMPTTASQALSIIFKTIGPHTIMLYLNFALGRSIDSCPPILQEPEAAVGLEKVAELIEEPAIPCRHTPSPSQDKAETASSTQDTDTSDDDDLYSMPISAHSYGPISDKIGEACACWLTRWAKDMVSFEQHQVESNRHTRDYELQASIPEGPIIWRRGGLDPAWITAIVSADTLFVKDEKARYELARSIVELRRKDGILALEEAEWQRLFNEAIYYSNMSADDIISISQDLSPTTGQPFVPMATLQSALWSHSILRNHITKPKSGSPTPSHSSSPPSPPHLSTVNKDKDLGLALATSDLRLNSTKELGDRDKQVYYAVPGDSTWRMGDNGEDGQEPSGHVPTMDDLFTFSHSPCVASARQSHSSRSATRKVATDKDAEICSTEQTFFGLKRERRILEDCIESDPTNKRRWTVFPPCRFGVEFWDIDSLKEKSRLYSQTVWCSGSLFNVYLQVVSKKGHTQLGIYLYRQSAVEAIPPPSAPSPLMADQHHGSASDTLHSSPERPALSRMLSSPSVGVSPPSSPHFVVGNLRHAQSAESRPRSSTLGSSISPPSAAPVTQSSSPTTGFSAGPSTSVNTLPYARTPISPQQPYRDPRASISAYFMISCASATGTSQMRFTSAPDLFTVGQSWGWKTSSLRTEEYMEVGEDATPVEQRTVINSLRATVVLGLT